MKERFFPSVIQLMLHKNFIAFLIVGLLTMACSQQKSSGGTTHDISRTVETTVIAISAINARVAPTVRPTSIPTPTIVPLAPIHYPECLRSTGQLYGQSWGGDTEQGTDFNCGFRTVMYALWSGTVIKAERTCWNTSCSSTSGGVVMIDADVPKLGIESTYYLHLDEIAGTIHKGKHVSRGTFLGWTGGQTYGGHWNVSPEYSTGPHIEIGFSAWFLCYDVLCKGKNRNPLTYIEGAL